MAQIAEQNDGLRDGAHAQEIPASLLGLQGAEASRDSDDNPTSLPGDALLVGVTYDGPPEFPYLYAHFRTVPEDDGWLTVDLHTEALRKLSHLLHLQHIWGGSST